MTKESTQARLRLVRPQDRNVPLNIEQIVREYSRYVATIAHRILGGSNDVDDIVQEVFIQADKYLHTIRDWNMVKSWLATVTVRRCSKLLKRRSRSWSIFRTQVELTSAEPELATCSQGEREIIRDLYKLLEGVAVAKRVPWILSRIHQATTAEVAQTCDISVSTVKRYVATVDSIVRKGLGNDFLT